MTLTTYFSPVQRSPIERDIEQKDRIDSILTDKRDNHIIFFYFSTKTYVVGTH